MALDKTKLIQLMNEGLEMEYASQIQYLTQAAITAGPYAEGLMARFKEIASDEMEHAEILRNRIAALGGIPTTKVGEIQIHKDSLQAVKINLRYERETVAFYRKLLNLIPHDEVILYEAIETSFKTVRSMWRSWSDSSLARLGTRPERSAKVFATHHGGLANRCGERWRRVEGSMLRFTSNNSKMLPIPQSFLEISRSVSP